jgi:Na+/melibiose symporter-like transporter
MGLALVFSPTADMLPGLRWALIAAGMFVFFVGYTLYAIPYWSLVEDYSQGNKEVRTNLSNALGVGVLFATGLGFIVSPLLVDGLGFLPGALIFAAIGTVLMTLPYFASPKGGAPPQPQEHMPPLLESLIAGVTHRRFLAVIALFAGAQMSFTIMTGAAVYISEKLLDGTIKDVAKLLGPFLGTAVPTFAFVPMITRRIGWEKATVIGTVALGFAYMGAGLLGKGIIGSPMTTAMIVFACAGPGAAFGLGLEGEAIARCAEESKYKSTAMYFGVYNFIVKGLNGVMMLLFGYLAGKGTVSAVRAMPMFAGGFCILGVILYAAIKRGAQPPVEPSAPQALELE